METCLGKFFETEICERKWLLGGGGGGFRAVILVNFPKYSMGKQNSKLKMTNLMEAGKYDIQSYKSDKNSLVWDNFLKTRIQFLLHHKK